MNPKHASLADIPGATSALLRGRSRACLEDVQKTHTKPTHGQLRLPNLPALDYQPHESGHAHRADACDLGTAPEDKRAPDGGHTSAPAPGGEPGQLEDKPNNDDTPNNDEKPLSPAEQAALMLKAMQAGNVLGTTLKRPAAAIDKNGKGEKKPRGAKGGGKGGKGGKKGKTSTGSSKVKGCSRCRGYSCTTCADPAFKGKRYSRKEWVAKFG